LRRAAEEPPGHDDDGVSLAQPRERDDLPAVRPDDFENLLTWLEQRSSRGTGTARVRDVLGGQTKPVVTWPR